MDVQVITLVAVLLLSSGLYYAWHTSQKKKNDEKNLRELFYEQCPEKLLRILKAHYLGIDGTFKAMTQEARRALEHVYGSKGVEAAIDILETGSTTILLYVPERHFRRLSVVFRNGKIIAIDLSPPFIACTLLDD